MSSIQWLGDKSIEYIKNNYDTIMQYVGSGLAEETKAYHLLELLDQANVLKPDVETYRRALPGTWERSYEFLLTAMERHVADEGHRINGTARLHRIKGMQEGRQAAAEGPDGTAASVADGQTGCFNCGGDHWARDCAKVAAPTGSIASPGGKGKPPASPRAEPAAKTETGGKGRESKGGGAKGQEKRERASDRKDADGKFPCFWNWSERGCRAGDDCEYSHTLKPTGAELEVFKGTRKDRSASLHRGGKGPGKGACKYFKEGRCKSGEGCLYSHE